MSKLQEMEKKEIYMQARDANREKARNEEMERVLIGLVGEVVFLLNSSWSSQGGGVSIEVNEVCNFFIVFFDGSLSKELLSM